MIVGIDLGTTNSLVGYWQGEGVTLVPNALGQLLTPSVVGEDDKGTILVGESARDRLVSHPGKTAAAFKRYMGTEPPSRSAAGPIGQRNCHPSSCGP